MIQSLPEPDREVAATADAALSKTNGARLNAEEAADLMARVAQLAAAGLPLSTGLRAAAEELPRRQARAMTELAAALEAGQPLDAAIAELADRIPPHLRGLILAGLRSGKLARVLDGYLQHERRDNVMHHAWLAVAYPALLLALVIGVVLFFGLVVARAVIEVARDFGTELPGQTQWLASLGNLSWLVWLGVPAAVFALILLDRVLLGGRVRQMLVSLVPLVGSLGRWQAMSSLCRLLSLLVEQQVPLPEALRLASEALRDPLLKRDAARVAERVADGRTIEESLRGTRIPLTFAALCSGAAGSGAIAESLRAGAELYEHQAQAELKLLRIVAPALAFVFVVLVVLFLLSSSFLPLIKVIETLT